jgi:flagellar motor switch protein FliN/FliY
MDATPTAPESQPAAEAAPGDTPQAPAPRGGAPARGAATPAPVQLPSFDATGARAAASDLDLLGDVTLRVKVELGRTTMLVEDVLRLNENSVVELDKAAGDPVDIYVNDRHVARGEVLVLDDNFCVRISEIIDSG